MIKLYASLYCENGGTKRAVKLSDLGLHTKHNAYSIVASISKKAT